MIAVKVVHLKYELDPETTPMSRYVAREVLVPGRQLRYGSQAKGSPRPGEGWRIRALRVAGRIPSLRCRKRRRRPFPGRTTRSAPSSSPPSHYLPTPPPVLGACGSVKAPLGLLPVHNVPPRLYVLRPAVLVLEVVSMLPHVQAYHRRLALHQRRVLVGGGLYGQRPLWGGYKPRPPAAEQSTWRRGRPELLLEGVKRAERGIDGGGKVPAGAATPLPAGAHYLPEHRVVGVPAAVVAHGCPYVLWHGVYVGQELFEGAGVGLGVLRS